MSAEHESLRAQKILVDANDAKERTYHATIQNKSRWADPENVNLLRLLGRIQ